MKISVVSFSVCGALLANKLSVLSEEGHEVSFYIAKRHAGHIHTAQGDFEPFTSVFALTKRLFACGSALVFIGACGIAVRAIAPLIKSKLTDPAVVVIDETGRFAVSLLSGHAGGANELTWRLAGIIGAMPVITTASDAYAQLGEHTQSEAHEKSAAMSATKADNIGGASDMIRGVLAQKNLVLGIGFRKGLSAETIERTVTVMLWDKKIPLLRVADVATIDVKLEDDGLREFAKAHKLPVTYNSAAELAAVSGDFAHSDKVMSAVGVGNVCERACVLRGGNGRLIMRKTARAGITVAVFERGNTV